MDTVKHKLTLQRVDDDIARHLRKKGISSEGQRFLRGAYILMQADVLDQLLLMHSKGQQDKLGNIGIIERALAVTRLINSGDSPDGSDRPDGMEILDGVFLADPPVTGDPGEGQEDEDPAPAFGA